MQRAFLSCVLFGAGLILSLVVQQAGAQRQDQVRLLAQQIFHEADNNRNDSLNRTEYREAIGLLQGTTANLARSGQHKGNAKNAKGKSNGDKATSPDPDGDEKVSLPEWEAFVVTYISEAGDAYQKAKERYQAARKKAAERNKNRRRRRRR